MVHDSSVCPPDESHRLARLVAALHDPACYPHRVDTITVLETHISVVLLTGGTAYKLKKPLALGFLDFSTLEKRRFYCEEELRLNRRLAPHLYLDVVPIGGSIDCPRVGGGGEPIEYAVRMREFPQDGLFDCLLARGDLDAKYIDALAEVVTGSHDRAARAPQSSEFGSFAAITRPAAQNFDQLRELLGEEQDPRLEVLRSWTLAQEQRLEPVFARRKQAGFVRECHGDLHLGNVVLFEGRPQIFDCIEFDPALRWIDVVSEIAFTVMDLNVRGRPDLGNRFLNRWLEIGGDYGSLGLLPYYLAYRSMVRAKVARIRQMQETAPGTASAPDYDAQVAYAMRLTRPDLHGLMITHGYSGSGKTFFSQTVIEALGAVRIRSDVERKRLHGMVAGQRSGSGVYQGIYTAEQTAATYNHIMQLAQCVAESGMPVVVDASFLKRAQRDGFRRLARSMGVPFLILDCQAPVHILRERVASRAKRGEDASEATGAVLETQLRDAEPLTDEEREWCIRIDSCSRAQTGVLAEIRSRLKRLERDFA